MGEAKTEKAGLNKSINRKPIHVQIEETTFNAYKRWCSENNTTPTTHTRVLIEEFVASKDK